MHYVVKKKIKHQFEPCSHNKINISVLFKRSAIFSFLKSPPTALSFCVSVSLQPDLLSHGHDKHWTLFVSLDVCSWFLDTGLFTSV